MLSRKLFSEQSGRNVLKGIILDDAEGHQHAWLDWGSVPNTLGGSKVIEALRTALVGKQVTPCAVDHTSLPRSGGHMAAACMQSTLPPGDL